MQLEFRHIAGEEVAIIVLDCTVCGGRIPIPEREMKTSTPVRCSSCNNARHLSYREYVMITDKIAPQLLEHAVIKLGGGRPRPSLNPSRKNF